MDFPAKRGRVLLAPLARNVVLRSPAVDPYMIAKAFVQPPLPLLSAIVTSAFRFFVLVSKLTGPC